MHVWKIWKALERKLYCNLTGHLGLVHMLYRSQQFLHKHNKLPYIFINILVLLLDLMKLKGHKIICPQILPFGHKNLDFCDFKMARKPHLWKTLRLDNQYIAIDGCNQLLTPVAVAEQMMAYLLFVLPCLN